MNNKRGRGGFTLVELIVVLVILAILAALLIPALTGYIDKSKKSQVIAETRMLHQAIQTELSDTYGTTGLSSYTNITTGNYTTRHLAAKNGTSEQQTKYNDIVTLAEVSPLTSSGGGEFGAYFTEDGKAAVIVYRDGKGKVGIYFGDTGETLAYDEDDFNTLDVYFSSINGYVTYTPKYEAKDFPNRFIQKENILMIMGYKNA